MNITGCMKRDVVYIPLNTTIGEAARVMSEKHVGILPVVDKNGKAMGVVRMNDLLSLELPDFVSLVADIDFVHDFGVVETTRPDPAELSQPIARLMKPMETIDEASGLLRAYALMIQNDLYDLPVTNDAGELVGLVSRVDIGSTLLSNWAGEGKA